MIGREHAKEVLENLVNNEDIQSMLLRTDIEAMKCAISALSTEGEYIKKEDTIEYLNDLFGEMNHVSFNDVLQCIDSLQTYSFSDSSENEEKWIPLSSGKLPDETKTKGHGLCNVLVTHKFAGITRTHQAVFSEGKFLKLETFKEDDTVTAWQPLPEPYKKGE